MRHKKLSARILSLVLTVAMVGTMMPQTVLAAKGDAALGTSSIETTTRTITAFDELDGNYTKSVPFDGHTYALTVKLGTPIEKIKLPTELGVTVEKTTTTTTPPAKDEVQDEVVDSGEAPKDTAPADEPEDKTVAETPAADEPASTEPAAQVADTDTTVSDNKPATPSDAEQAPAPEEKPDADVPPADEPEQDKPEQDKETTVTETTQETISVTWKGDREYTPDQNSKVIYTPVLPEGYALKDGVALPTIYVMVGKQARTADIANGTCGNCNWVIDGDGKLTISPTSGTDGVLATTEFTSLPDWNNNATSITSVVVNSGVKTDASAQYLFYNLKNCTIMDLSGLDTSNATNITGMFKDCSALTGLVLSNFNTSNVTDMFCMFSGCTELKNIDLSGFDTSNSKNMKQMFSGCSSLISIDVSGFDTANVTSMTEMFYGCANLTSIDLNSFNLSKIWDMNYMFGNCTNLTELDFSSFDTRSVTYISDTFYKCNSLGSIVFGANFDKAVTLPVPTALGESFTGWYTNPDCSGTPVVGKEGGSYANPAGTTVYSKIAGPSITVAAQSITAIYGTAASPTFTVTNSSFGGKYPAFSPSVAWVGTAPTGVTPAFTESNAKITMNTTAATPAGEYKFKVVSPKADSGNYESAEATLKVDKLEATITWGATTSFPYNGSTQAPTATVGNKVPGDDVTVTVTGGEIAVGSYTATASALAGAKAENYTMPTTGLTQVFTITKAAYDGTQAAAPDKTPASKTDTSITLKTVAPPDGEAIEYGIKNPDGTITWQDSPTFTPLTADTEYTFYTRVKGTANHDAGTISAETKIKTDMSDTQKIAAAKTAVENALNNFTATNATNADAVMAAVNKALTDAGIAGVIPSWDASGAFSKTESTEDNDGSVTGKIKLTCGSESNTVTLNKTIAQLPSDPAEKVRLVKAAIEAALNAYTATNATTAADIKAIVDKANTDSGVIGVTVAWKTPSDFTNKNSTNSENGKVTGTFDLSCTKGGNTSIDTVLVNCPIERSNKQKLAGAIEAANADKKRVITKDAPASAVESGTKFVSTAQMKALADAIKAAEDVLNNNAATDAEIIAAATALNDAITTFKTAIKTGTYVSGGNDNSGGNNSGGSSSGGGSTPTVPQPPSVPAPITGIQVPATVDNKGNAAVTISDKNMQDAIDKAIANAKKNGIGGNAIAAMIHVTTGNKNANTVTVNLPKTVQEKVINGKISNTIVVVDRPDISINMNLTTITEINRQAKSDVQLSATRMDNNTLSTEAKTAIGTRPTFDLKVTYANGKKTIRNFGLGLVSVEIPYTLQKGENAKDICAVYVDGNGKVSYIKNSVYDEKAKVVRFTTNHFSIYAVGYKVGNEVADGSTYTVQKGDNFWKIARKHKCSMFELAKINGKNIFNIIYPGEVLSIPQK